MNFVEWYKEIYGDEWHEDYAGLYSFCYKMTMEYDEYCKDNNIKPVWNG